MQIEITGGEQFARAARKLRSITPAEHQKLLAAGIRKALRKAPAAVKKDIPDYMPKGYEPVLAGAMKFRTKQHADGVTIGGSAQGKTRPREIKNMQGGSLRAPTYPRGRRARWAWHTQRIKAGFFTEPITKMAPKIRAELVQVMQAVAAKVTGG